MTETPRLVLAYRAILAEAERLNQSKKRGTGPEQDSTSLKGETDSYVSSAVLLPGEE